MEQEKITLLYVDDEDINHVVFKAVFESSYNLYTAGSPIEALEILDRHHNEIIVVISDMRMPQMNGVELIRKAKKKYEDILYFILTGFEYNTEIDRAIKDKVVNKFFTKPLDGEEIESAILKSLKS